MIVWTLILSLAIGAQAGIFVSILHKIGNQTVRIANRLNDAVIIDNSNVCQHELAPCEYYYDDDWGHKGREIFSNGKTLGYLCYCKKCGALFVNWNIKASESGGDNE